MQNAEEPIPGCEPSIQANDAVRPRLAEAMAEQEDPRVGDRIEQTLDDLRQDIRAYHLRRRIHVVLSTILWSGLAALVALNPVNFFWAFTPIVMLQAMVTIATTYRFHSLRPLIDAGDAQAVNALALACWKGDGLTRRAATEALKRILPTVRAGDAARITPEGMGALLGLLSIFDDEALLIAILAALEQVGDAKAVAAVERLLVSTARGRIEGRRCARSWWVSPARNHASDRMEPVRAAALQCLPYLKLRVEHDRAKSMLLRPVTDPVDAATHLLRPAQSGSRTSQEPLLRPAALDDAERIDP